MKKKSQSLAESTERRKYGMHLTSIDIFYQFILPEIKKELWNYCWVDLFAGEGNLILPILELIPSNQRVKFFKEHIWLFDNNSSLIKEAIKNAVKYGIKQEIAQEKILVRDTLCDYPIFIKNSPFPIFHITNPPYLYLGYIVKKAREHLQYFTGPNEFYQDLYQIALVNDLRNNISKMIYIIPSNFLFGYSASNKIRKDFFEFYKVEKAIIFEKKIFEYTGTNVCICFFNKKGAPHHSPIKFKTIKINQNIVEKEILLKPENCYRAGNEFDEFVEKFRSGNPLKIKFYLNKDELEKQSGKYKIKLLDANQWLGNHYQLVEYSVNHKLYERIVKNPLFIRTIDTGGWEGRAGLYLIPEVFNADGILVSEAKYRTHPIQIFIEPSLNYEEICLLRKYFNWVLEELRKITDSEFMTTYKYSNSEYTRKYLGLSQAKALIETFPILELDNKTKKILSALVSEKDLQGIVEFLDKRRNRKLCLFSEM